MEEKKEEIKQPVDEIDRDYFALRTIFRGFSMAKIWDRNKEDHAIARLYRLYIKAKGLYKEELAKSNEKKDKEK
jgi:hypothetical protein